MTNSKMIGAEIKQRRESKSMSQKQLAIAIDVSPSCISLIESGKRWPGWKALQKMGTVLGTFDVVFGEPNG